MLPVWWDARADGPTNMAADECLAAEAIARGGPVVRIYGWTETTVSLGAFQRVADARAEPSIAGASLIRRPSGGGAIVHGSDVTYAAAVPKHHPLGGSPQAFYTVFHAALVETLRDLGVAARMWPTTTPSGRHRAESFFCFDRRAEGDVVAARPGRGPADDDPKIMGSAQRRLAAAVVQHGSLLLRRAEGVGPAARHPALAELHGPGSTPDDRRLVERWLELVAGGLGGGVSWQTGSFAGSRAADVASLAAAYAAGRWIERR
jgi:lipoate-protein ligase A